MKKFNWKLAVVMGCLVATLGCSRIDTGNVGVESTLGQVKSEELLPGVYVTVMKTVHEFTTRELTMTMIDMKAKTRDNITMADYDIDVYFKVAPNKVADLYLKYQGDVTIDEKTGDGVVAWGRVGRSAREAAYKAASEYDALTMHTNRSELAGKIQKYLQSELNLNDPETFTVTDINVRALVTDVNLEKTIREKVETQNKIDQKQKEIELAVAESNRRRVEAEGEARANQIIAASLTGPLVTLKLAEIQRDGVVAASGKAGNTVLIGGSAQPLINVGR